MTDLTLLAAGALANGASGSGAPAHLDPVRLFMDADIVVKCVLAALIMASVWGWTIIISFALRVGALKRKTEAYEADFWKARDIDAFQNERASGKGADLPVAKVVSAALGEWRRSVSGKVD
ncbi:MAG TPA: Tol-Pal system subunit TolQ, partial [Novosphingobium sp.]|nr:Tol-Pal system subunit TolQ [Novosphingobium sp.]